MSTFYNEDRPSHPKEQHLVRSLGFLDVMMIGIAGLVGGAIFVLTGPAIGLAGGSVIIAFIINAIITLFTAMGYAELGSAIPEAGGGYLWVRKGLPRPNAFISGWMAWFAHIVAGSLYAVGFGSFLFSLLKMTHILGDQPLFGIFPFDKLIAVASIAAFTYINVKGVSKTGKVGTIVTIIQLGTIAALIVGGLWTIDTHPNWKSNFVDFMPNGLGGIVAAMGLTFIAFEGYEIIVQAGEEVKNPKKNIPRAIFTSLAIVVILYCLVAFVSIGAIFPKGVAAWKYIGNYGDLGITKAAEFFLPYGALIVIAGGIVSSLAALNATTFSSSRVSFAMGRHYNLPHQLSSIHPKYRTPYVAIIISGAIMAVMAYALPLDQIAVAAGVIFLLLFTQVNIAVINIRRVYGDKLDYGFKIPFFPVIPIIGVFLKLGLAFYLLVTQPFSWVISALWVAVGFALYRMYTFKKEIEHYAPIVTSEGDLTRKEYRVLIPYTPENPDRLINYAIRIAKENDGEVNVLRVLTVPDQTPLSAGIAFADAARKSFEPLEKRLEQENILNHHLFRISHETSEAILATIEEQKIDLVIIDFETYRNNRVLQTLATCNVLAVRTTGDDITLFEISDESRADLSQDKRSTKKNMVVLYDGGDHSDLILKATSWLEHSGKFNVCVLAVNKRREVNHDAKEFEDIVAEDNKRKECLEQVGFEFNEIYLSEETGNSSEKSAHLILSAVNTSQPDLLVTSATIGNFSFFNNNHFLSLLDQLRCPIVIARQFNFPGVHRAKAWCLKLIRR
ncbi:MAG TPA: amino acid permease [Candidatus Bathyarchaeia archaeon]|nr:amino acid permease [Candidatus Bathyarchaeia archaeon]